jgi:peptidoglycan hydrolase CwlO-like protein
MINFLHRIFPAKTEDDLRLESLKENNVKLKESVDRIEENNVKLKENNVKLKESVDRLRNKRRTPN